MKEDTIYVTRKLGKKGGAQDDFHFSSSETVEVTCVRLLSASILLILVVVLLKLDRGGSRQRAPATH